MVVNINQFVKLILSYEIQNVFNILLYEKTARRLLFAGGKKISELQLFSPHQLYRYLHNFCSTEHGEVWKTSFFCYY